MRIKSPTLEAISIKTFAVVLSMAVSVGAAVKVHETVVLPGGNATWRGSTNSDFKEAGNWSSPPTAGAIHDGGLTVANGSGFPLNYTESEGETAFNVQLLVGNPGGPNGVINVMGGTLTFNCPQYEAIIGQVSAGTLTVSGGALNLTGTDTWLGNESNGRGGASVFPSGRSRFRTTS
jgi:hypothetical protein